MPPLADGDDAGEVHLRAGVVVARGHLGQGAERVQLRHGLRAALDALHARGHAHAQLGEEAVLQLADALARAGELGLQLLQLGREIALVGDQRLLAYVLRRQLHGPGGVRHVDVIAENLVVADLELLYPGALALARFQLGDELRAVVADVAQAVHLLRVAAAEDAALAHGEGGLVADGALDVLPHVGQLVQRRRLPQQGRRAPGQQPFELRQLRAALAQRGQVAPVGGAEHRPAHQALHVADAGERAPQLLPQHALAVQLADGGEAALDGHGREQRPLHPGAQQPPAHGRLGAVEHPQQAAALFARALVLRQLQAAPRRVVQLHVFPALEEVERVDIRKVALLRLFHIAQQRAAGPDGRGGVPQAQGVHILRAELLAEGGRAGHVVEPAAVRLQQAAQPLAQEGADALVRRRALAEHGLARGKARQLVADVRHAVLGEGGGAEFARGNVAEGRRAADRVQVHGADIVGAPLLEHGALRHRAGGDHADHVPLHQPLGQRGVLRLLADGHLVALGDQPGDIGLRRVVGHAAHGRLLIGGLAAVAGGERQVELPGGLLRVLVEELVEVPQAEEQQAVAVLALYLVVLRLHRRQFCHVTPPVSRRRAPRCSSR